MTKPPHKEIQYFGKDLEAMSFAKNYHEWIVAEFLPYLRGEVAEVGAGTGNLSKLLLNSEVKFIRAFEPSRNMYVLLEKALGQERRVMPIHGFFDGATTRERFDTIVYVNVLEHIEDDLSELRNAHRALHATGHLLVFVPALSWLYSDLDRQVGHFRRYEKNQLVRLVEAAGFSVVKARYFDIAGILPWYVNFVIFKNSIGSRSVSLYDKFVVPVMRRIERALPPPVGKNVLLVARRAQPQDDC
jgi:SAM-dependent methyltransferase